MRWDVSLPESAVTMQAAEGFLPRARSFPHHVSRRVETVEGSIRRARFLGSGTTNRLGIQYGRCIQHGRSPSNHRPVLFR